jgi:cytochrome c1
MKSLALVFPLVVVLAACGGDSGSGADANPIVEEGRELYKQKACANCHSVDGSKLIAPTWKGLYGSQVELDDGTKVEAEDAYLRESMLQPSAKTVKGFPKGLMETVISPESLNDGEVKALIAYIKSLS